MDLQQSLRALELEEVQRPSQRRGTVDDDKLMKYRFTALGADVSPNRAASLASTQDEQFFDDLLQEAEHQKQEEVKREAELQAKHNIPVSTLKLPPEVEAALEQMGVKSLSRPTHLIEIASSDDESEDKALDVNVGRDKVRQSPRPRRWSFRRSKTATEVQGQRKGEESGTPSPLAQ